MFYCVKCDSKRFICLLTLKSVTYYPCHEQHNTVNAIDALVFLEIIAYPSNKRVIYGLGLNL